MDQPDRTAVAPTASAMVARYFVEALEAHGVDCTPILAAAGVSRAVLVDPDARLPLPSYNAIFDGALAATGDPALLVEVGRQIPIAAYRIVGYCAAAADTLRGALRTMGQYFALLKGGFEFRVLGDGDREYLEYGPREASAGVLTPAVAIAGVAAILAFAEAVTRRPLRTTELRFHFPAPPRADLLERAFGTRLRFDAPAVEIHPVPGALDAPTITADPTLRARFDALAQDALASERRVQEYAEAMAALDRALRRARAVLEEARRGPGAPSPDVSVGR